MNHERIHELLCLRLYDELSSEEAELLRAHLACCADCQTFARELEETLGAHVAHRSREREHDLPANWSATLAASLGGERRRSRRARVLTFAAGLAAGVALLLAARNLPGPPAAPREHLARFGDAPPFVPRADPAPRTTSQGTLAHAGAWLRR